MDTNLRLFFLILAILLLQIRTSHAHRLIPVIHQRFTGDPCDAYNASSCTPPLRCIDSSLNPVDTCSRLSVGCICRSTEQLYQTCNCEIPCPLGEKCVISTNSTTEGICKSRLQPDEKITCANTDANRDVKGFNFEACTKQSECADGRNCVYYPDNGGNIPCDGHSICECLTENSDDMYCSCKYPQCQAGEECVIIENSSYCVSKVLQSPLLFCEDVDTDDDFGNPDDNANSDGLASFETCLRDSDCAGDRICNTNDGDLVCGKGECSCVPNHYEDITCSCSHPECLEGDSCGFFSSQTYCLSVNIFKHPLTCNGRLIEPDDEEVGKGKFTDEACFSNRECAGPRSCINIEGDPCKGMQDCRCRPDRRQDFNCACGNTKCLSGDVCAFPTEYTECNSNALDIHPITCNASMETIPTGIPLAITVTPVPEQVTISETIQQPVQEQVCIDAKALSDFQPHQLLYRKHVVARVLCDSSGSCATPGHMVHYGDTPMMMKKYCEIVSCDQKIMEVNSPRYRRALQIPSNTQGLKFTAFAARYGTRAEEAFMAVAIHMGL